MTAVTSMITGRPVCLKCGIIEKSGKSSCCGRGGSWFGNCGSVGNGNLDHTWYEGIQFCKTQSLQKRASSRQSRRSQRVKSVNGEGKGYSRSVMATAKALELTSVNNLIHIPAPAATIMTTTMITHTAKEATIATGLISQDVCYCMRKMYRNLF